MSFSRNVEFGISGSYDNTIKVWDLKQGLIQATMTGHSDRVVSLVVSHDDQWIVSGSMDRTIRIWNLRKGRE